MMLFFLLALIPLSMVGAFSIKTAEELIINMVTNQLENVADDKVALLERWFSERKADLQVVAGSSILKSMDPSLIGPYLNLVGINYKVYKKLVVLSPDGAIVFNSRGHLDDPERTDGNNYSMVENLYISDVMLHPEEKESVFWIASPIRGDGGQVKGMLSATVGTSTILFMVLKVALGKTGECYLVDKNGTFLAHKEPRRILTENIAQSESFKNIFGKKDPKRIYDDYRGIEVLGASRKVSGTDWYLVVEQDRDEAFKSADILKRYVYLAIAFSILSAIVLAWLISYYIVNPIQRLSTRANMLAKGEFKNEEVESRRTDEIGKLYQAFENMALQLLERQHDLEKRVDLKKAKLKETDIILKQTRLAAARSEKLAALGRLGAGVTHEIRTPLTSIKLFLESVPAEIGISPEYEEDFRIAMMQISRIEATINRFLDFAKPQELILASIDVQHLIEETLLVVRPMANKQECAVHFTAAKGLKKIRGDKKLLEDALINLMVNALESMTSYGKLTIAQAMDECEFDGKAVPCVRIDISDTGSGISEENIPSIFDPFFTTKSSGTGLGLPMVHNTVYRHGGTIHVESVLSQGTLFSIFLPIWFDRLKE